MPSPRTDFTWGIPDGGFHLGRTASGRRAIVMRVPAPRTSWLSEYDPLSDCPQLYQRFANLNAMNHEAVLEFANEFGWLGLYSASNVEPERYSHWRREILAMRF